MKTNEENLLTITLTDRPPVRIDKEKWPIIARAIEFDGEFEHQANRTFKIIVRQKSDHAKTIIYGIYSTRWQGEKDRRGGVLLDDSSDLASAIKQVADSMGFSESVAQECIATLPAEDLD